MRTGNRRASFDILVELEKLIQGYVVNDEALAEDLIGLLPKLFDRSSMENNNFRAFYINDFKFPRLKNITTLIRRWEDKNGRSFARKTKAFTNRRLVQRTLECFEKEGFEYREDYSLANALVRQMIELEISPFDRFVPLDNSGEKKKVLVPKNWKKGTEKYVTD